MADKILKTEVLYREIAIPREAIDTEKRTVELSFSSESPVERYFGIEILDHSSGSVRLDRLNNGGQLLFNHNADDYRGVIEFAKVSDDRRGKALVRFSRSPKADEIFQDVQDGIIRSVSVGYLIHKMVLESEAEGVSTYRAMDWEPIEISLVTIPADTSVGVGRSQEELSTQVEPVIEPEQKTEVQEMENNETKTAPIVNVDEAREAARKDEQSRIREIYAIADKHGMREMAREFVDNGKSAADFGLAVLEKRGQIQKVDPNADRIGMNEGEVKEYSFLRAIRAMAAKRPELAPYEMECSDAVAKRTGKTPKGFFVPMDVTHGKRDMSKGTSAAGGYLVGTDHRADLFIEILRNKMLLTRLGARVLDGLVGDIAIPRQDGGATGYWVTEGSNITSESAMTASIGQVAMAPKTVGAYVDITRKLLMQSSPAVEALIREDLAQTLALQIDRVGFHGSSSSSEPVGIVNTTGVATVALGSSGLAPTYKSIIDLETEVSQDNADIGNLAYVTNAKVRGKLKQIFTNATYGEIPLWMNGPEPGVGMLNGYKAYVTNQISSVLEKGGSGAVCSAIFFGNWADVLIGYWGSLDINVDTAVAALSGGIRLIGLQDADVGIRHGESFAMILDALTT